MSLNKKIIVGNTYKPPRDNNNPTNMNAFMEELEEIMHELRSSRTDALIYGDCDINVL